MANELDMTQLMGMVTKVMTQVDMEKLKQANNVEEIKVFFKHETRDDNTGKLNINLITKPDSPSFSESFLEILKVVLMASPDIKITFKQVE